MSSAVSGGIKEQQGWFFPQSIKKYNTKNKCKYQKLQSMIIWVKVSPLWAMWSLIHDGRKKWPCSFNFLKGYLLQNLLCPPLNTLSHISWHDMKLKLTLGIPFDKKVGHWIHELHHMIPGLACELWTVLLPNLLRTNFTYSMWKMIFHVRTYTPERIFRKNYVASFIMSSTDPIY